MDKMTKIVLGFLMAGLIALVGSGFCMIWDVDPRIMKSLAYSGCVMLVVTLLLCVITAPDPNERV